MVGTPTGLPRRGVIGAPPRGSAKAADPHRRRLARDKQGRVAAQEGHSNPGSGRLRRSSRPRWLRQEASDGPQRRFFALVRPAGHPPPKKSLLGPFLRPAASRRRRGLWPALVAATAAPWLNTGGRGERQQRQSPPQPPPCPRPADPADPADTWSSTSPTTDNKRRVASSENVATMRATLSSSIGLDSAALALRRASRKGVFL
jgi:hypothetical protein